MLARRADAGVVIGSVFGEALEVLGLAAAAAARRFGPRPPWQFAQRRVAAGTRPGRRGRVRAVAANTS